jgi:hypothetical protein
MDGRLVDFSYGSTTPDYFESTFSSSGKGSKSKTTTSGQTANDI